ncbi:hypothetical protein LOK49_LG13G01935 [Camellia lanceoleosa]|uniref:Uncharacterized protein n=1 Tax=Camellia lanceoleosa TaxID=1840588 RepID=A0ACC0FNC1_9ERIC|nr:hypothetical protein LOK49_LG13G01935 [Camellia lanceoleosa]
MAALQYLDSLRSTHPELSEWYNTLSDLYQRKLWHQLTLKLEQAAAVQGKVFAMFVWAVVIHGNVAQGKSTSSVLFWCFKWVGAGPDLIGALLSVVLSVLVLGL